MHNSVTDPSMELETASHISMFRLQSGASRRGSVAALMSASMGPEYSLLLE